MSQLNICAIVVTFNRKELLLNCLNALQGQTYPISHIVVVNNASSDGTVEFLHQQGWNNNDKFSLLNLEENQGGAGGFYTAIKFAYEREFDYIWLMDDDGYPSKDCLKNLTAYANNNSYIGPIVLDTKQEDKLSFSLRLANSLQVFESYSQVLDYLHNEVNIPNVILPFNGTFIARELIQKIGLPHKCYFIWGDEREYTLRAKKYNADIFTVSSAIFYHPADSSSSIPMFFGKLRFNYANSDLKQYCFCRNTIAMFKEHQGLHYSFAFLIKTLWFFIFTKPNFKKLKLACRAMWHGLRNDFSHHREYL